MRLFGRAVRAHQLYMHNNPTYLKTLEAVRGAFPALWSQTEEIVIVVTDTQLTWEGCVVLNEPDKTSDALPWVLYKDGVRELRLLAGVEATEIIGLVDSIARVRKAAADDDDLLTILWEREFQFVRYSYVDFSVDGAAPLDLDEEPKERLVDPAQIKEPPTEVITPPGVVSMEDFNTTLYFLEESEIEYLRDAVKEEYASDLRVNVVQMLLDTYETQIDPTIREEICGILDTYLVSLLSGRSIGAAATLLKESAVTATRARDIRPDQSARLLSLADRLSEPEALTQLLQSIDESVDTTPQAALNALFEELRGPALGTVLHWLSRTSDARVRAQLELAATRLAEGNTSELVRLIGSSQREVAIEAVRRAGSMKAAAAVTALPRLLVQQDAELKLAAVQALAEIATPGALQHLEKVLDDPSRDIRVAALKAFATRMHRPALARVETLIAKGKINGADLTEKMAVFEAFGAMCGDPGVALLDGLLNGKGLFGKRAEPEVRACAAMALGRVGTQAASSSLQKALGDKEILVRNAVNRAMRTAGPGGA